MNFFVLFLLISYQTLLFPQFRNLLLRLIIKKLKTKLRRQLRLFLRRILFLEKFIFSKMRQRTCSLYFHFQFVTMIQQIFYCRTNAERLFCLRLSKIITTTKLKLHVLTAKKNMREERSADYVCLKISRI